MTDPSLETSALADISAIVARQRSWTSNPRGRIPSFKQLIGLTLLTALLLLPFALSPVHLSTSRTVALGVPPFMRSEIYKQITGFLGLGLVCLELMLTIRKRSRTWPIHIKVAGSISFWRSLHIFCGVGLIAMVLVHTLGSTGHDYNAVFLRVFFGATLTALVGGVVETGLIQSTRPYFGRLPGQSKPLSKGPFIRGLRSLWLLSHICLVSVFIVMLFFHIALAFYHP